MTTPTTQREADERAQYWPHGATEVACSSCGLTMGESRLLAALKSGEMRIVHAATDQPSAGQVDEQIKAAREDGERRGREVIELHNQMMATNEHYRERVFNEIVQLDAKDGLHRFARASLTPTAPQAASQQVGATMTHGELADLVKPGRLEDHVYGLSARVAAMAIRKAAPDDALMFQIKRLQSVLPEAHRDHIARAVAWHEAGREPVNVRPLIPSTSAPQAATTAICQPSTLTGQPDAAICQPAATTASASSERDGWEAAAKALSERAAGHFRNKDYALQDECLQCASMLHDMKPVRRAPAQQTERMQPSREADHLTDEQVDAAILKCGVMDARWPTQAQFHAFANEIAALARAQTLRQEGQPLPAQQNGAVDVARDAARYRVLRSHVAPRDVSISMTLPVSDIPANQTIEERIDMLCDIVLSRTNTTGGSEE